jgi:hypothetical protein
MTERLIVTGVDLDAAAAERIRRRAEMVIGMPERSTERLVLLSAFLFAACYLVWAAERAQLLTFWVWT